MLIGSCTFSNALLVNEDDACVKETKVDYTIVFRCVILLLSFDEILGDDIRVGLGKALGPLAALLLLVLLGEEIVKVRHLVGKHSITA